MIEKEINVHESKDTIPLTTPFKNIALSFSGGGFRAASFSLGTLSYLQHLKLDYDELGNLSDKTLLDCVSFISSASGGTITASFYSMMRSKKQSFGAVYNKLLDLLHGESLLNVALKKLNDDAQWNKPGNLKRRNLINAFAEAYDELLFHEEKFGIYWQNLEKFEVCFNVTEFNRGLFFRFQTDGRDETIEYIGNKYIHFNTKSQEHKKIKLADILAASSCFPSGFEPIVFPEDFSYRDKSASLDAEDLRKALLVQSYQEELKPLEVGKNIGLMDGGITDNQGLYSAMLADNRRRENHHKEFDLMMIVDVASYFMDSYEVPPEKYNDGWQKHTIDDYLLKFNRIGRLLKNILITSVLLFLASLVLTFVAGTAVVHIVSAFFAGLFALLTLILWWLNRMKRKFQLAKILTPEFDLKKFLVSQIPSIKNFSESIIDKLIGYFKGTRLGVLQQMISARISSVVIMVSDINLKHIRRLIYDEFYGDHKWKDRRCSNFIYELTRQNEKARQRHLRENKLSDEDVELLRASGEIMDMAERAWLMGTTLWYDQHSTEKLKEVVSCGQFSSCVNLLRYMLEIEKNSTLVFTEPVRKMMNGIKEKLISDWKKFNENPCFLFELYAKH